MFDEGKAQATGGALNQKLVLGVVRARRMFNTSPTTFWKETNVGTFATEGINPHFDLGGG